MKNACRSRTETLAGVDAGGEGGNAADKIRVEPFWFADDLDFHVPAQDFFPQDFQLQFGEPVAEATMDTGAERQMSPRLAAVDDELIGVLDHFIISIPGDIPHGDFVAGRDLLAAQFAIGERRAPHMND
jgi:hypothetical protein